MFKKLFKRKEKLSWLIPLTGTLKPITEVPDQVFAQKTMGDGFCVDPTDGRLFSPVKGEIISIFPTKHAIGIMSDTGYEVLIHVGVDTVNLNGEGFKLLVNMGDRVEAGGLLLEIDIDSIKDRIPSLITAIVITNLEDKSVKISKLGQVKQRDTITLEIN